MPPLVLERTSKTCTSDAAPHAFIITGQCGRQVSARLSRLVLREPSDGACRICRCPFRSNRIPPSSSRGDVTPRMCATATLLSPHSRPVAPLCAAAAMHHLRHRRPHRHHRRHHRRRRHRRQVVLAASNDAERDDWIQKVQSVLSSVYFTPQRERGKFDLGEIESVRKSEASRAPPFAFVRPVVSGRTAVSRSC